MAEAGSVEGSTLVQVNGVRLEALRRGRGAPLLIVSPSWWPLGAWLVEVADHLTPDFELILFNYRGVGRSDAPRDGYRLDDFAAVLREFVTTCAGIRAAEA